MGNDSAECQKLFDRAGQGDHEALGELFQQHRDRLRRMVQLRMNAGFKDGSIRPTCSRKLIWSFPGV
jgi:hypothetical protein